MNKRRPGAIEVEIDNLVSFCCLFVVFGGH